MSRKRKMFKFGRFHYVNVLSVQCLLHAFLVIRFVRYKLAERRRENKMKQPRTYLVVAAAVVVAFPSRTRWWSTDKLYAIVH